MSRRNSEPLTCWEDLPLFLTVEQAAAVVQVGRSSAYKLTHEWETAGRGLPFVRIGGQKRIPRDALREFATGLTCVPVTT